MSDFDPPGDGQDPGGEDDGRDPGDSGSPGDAGVEDGGFQFNGDNVYDDEDYDDEARDEVPELEPNNPLVARLRDAVLKQLGMADARVTEDLRVKDEEVRVAKRKREDVGVELYGVQQQLARLQLQLEKTHGNYNVMAKTRQLVEEDMQAVHETLKARRKESIEQKKKLVKCQGELDKLNSTLKQLDAYNEQMKNEISVTRRATYKTEEAVSDLEREKRQQDIYIDELNEYIKKQQEQLALFEAQLISQREETKSAHDTLHEAAKEMESISFEKKQLLQQWRASLISMARRDEALKATEDALGELRERDMTLDMEISGYKKAIQVEQEKNEQLSAVLTKVKSESSFVEKQIEMEREKKQTLDDHYAMLKKSLDQTDAEVAKVTAEQSALETELEVIDKQIHKTMTDTQGMEDQILNNLSDQTTIQKSAQSTARSTEKLREEIREKQNLASQLQNELARIKVDALNTVSHNTGLKETLSELDAELKRKTVLIEKYEIEIRRRNDDIEKKQREVDRLNRRFEELTRDMVDENTGPLEATIHNLTKAIATKSEECAAMQRQWLNKQTELVSMQNEATSKSENISDLKAQQTVLNQKRVRLEGSCNLQLKETKELSSKISTMRTDMSKLNQLISRNSQKQAMLNESNFNLETDFVCKLKELEHESIVLEQQIAACKEEKAELLAEIVETERQGMLWERKIELEMETQNAMNAAKDGSDVLQAMKKEIHRMTLRASQLQRRQEELMVDLEKNILKREDITIRGKASLKSGVTQGMVKKAVVDLTKKVKEIDADTASIDQSISVLEYERSEVDQLLRDVRQEAENIQVQEQDVQHTINFATLNKQKNMDEILRYQRMVKRYQQLLDGRFESSGPPDAIQLGIEQQEEKLERIKSIIHGIREDHPRFESMIDRVLALT
jgi:chromosome segregation ATPase